MLLAAVLLAIPAIAAHAQEPDLKGCRRCDHRGVVDCKQHDQELLALERRVGYCAAAARCPDCAGALVVPCKRCDGGPETGLMELRRKEVAAWLAQEDPLETFLERPLIRIETPHFVFVTDAVRLHRSKKKKVDGHRFLHELARDAEEAAAWVDQHYEPGEKGYRTRMRLWFWENLEDHLKVMRHFLGSGSAGDFKMLGHAPLFSVHCHDHAFQGNEPQLRSLGVHNGVHMLLSNLWTEVWIGDMQGGWLDSGSAHWYEEQVYGFVQHYCIDEAAIPPDWNGGVWRAAIRELLNRKSERVYLPDLVREQTGSMTPEEQALAWSVYDWIVATKPEALPELLRGAKKRTPAREMFPELLGVSILEAESAWRAWVTETYPKKEKKARR